MLSRAAIHLRQKVGEEGRAAFHPQLGSVSATLRKNVGRRRKQREKAAYNPGANLGDEVTSSSSLAPGASCTVSINVQGTTAGVKNNSVTVSSTNGGTGNTSNASVTVVGPPTIAKAFGAASIPLNGSTSLSFTVTNPNTTVALTGVAFSDALPSGLVISTPNGLTGSCGTGTITPTAGISVISCQAGPLQRMRAVRSR